MDYLTWNNLIASHLFKPEMADKRVYLFVTKQLISDIGSRNDADLKNFIDSVKEGPPWTTRSGLCQKALQSYIDWRERNLEYPPYIGYLALFVLAAGLEGDFAPHAYHPKLHSLIGEEPQTIPLPSFYKTVDLWDDLEQWSTEDKSGNLGIFRVAIVGSQFYVGLPIAQSLLSENERATLPVIFVESGLDPITSPSDVELINQIIKHGSNRFRPRTLDLLKSSGSTSADLHAFLIDTLRDELQAWDGTIDPDQIQAATSGRLFITLSLCCNLDRVAKQARIFLRFKTKKEIPEDGLLLVSSDSDLQFYTEPSVQGWSTQLKNKSNIFNAAQINWLTDFKMRNEDFGWRFNLPGSPIRIFVDGARFGFRELMEVQKLPSSSPFFLAIHAKCLTEIEDWGPQACLGFKKVSITTGMPEEWHFFYADAVTTNGTNLENYPKLALPKTARLSFEGGIRIEKGNQFFHFAPPGIALESQVVDVDITCNEASLKKIDQQSIYSLPSDATLGNKLEIKAHRNGQDICRKISLSLIKDLPCPNEIIGNWFDKFGKLLLPNEEATGAVAGACVKDSTPPPFTFNLILETSDSRRVLLMGQYAGQVVDWPKEPLPKEWEVIWSISMKRNGKAFFCGNEIDRCHPMKPLYKDKKKLSLWKEVLWYWRKKVEAPHQKKLKTLWKEYQDAARRI